VANLRIVIKAVLLFAVFNALYVVVQPLNLLNRITVYNVLVPGRERLAFSEFPAESYNVTVLSVDQMVASHVIARPKAADEYRVVLIGDSSVWGYLLQPDETYAACLNRMGLRVGDRSVRAYNLGHPTLTVLKDLLILRRALAHDPDLILWSTSLASLYRADQTGFPLIRAHAAEVNTLVAGMNAATNVSTRVDPVAEPGLYERTFIGQRRQLADWLRYQLYGIGWAATGIDHILPRFVAPRPSVFGSDPSLFSPNMTGVAVEGQISESDLALGILNSGIDQAGDVPVIVINEPVYRGNGEVRLNTYYPRWAYDSYREVMRTVAEREGWRYADLWDAMPPEVFTDTDFHLNPAASCDYAAMLADLIP
jgi:hypothetical protein